MIPGDTLWYLEIPCDTWSYAPIPCDCETMVFHSVVHVVILPSPTPEAVRITIHLKDHILLSELKIDILAPFITNPPYLKKSYNFYFIFIFFLQYTIEGYHRVI